MAIEYLDYHGLGYFLSKLRALFAKKADVSLANIENDTFLNKATESGAGGLPVVYTDGDGNAYTATVPGLSELTVGKAIIMIPNSTSTTTMPTLDVNGLGEKEIRREISNSSNTTVAGADDAWLTENSAYLLIYNGDSWIVSNHVKPSAEDLYGNLQIYYAGTTAPENTSLFWIDTTANTGGLKYYNGMAWVVVPVAYS